jgi:hypothetical protein
MKPQTKVVLDHLLKAGSITQREAIMDHSVQSLSKRISELVTMGYDIKREFKKHPITQQRYARYHF